MSVLQKLGRGKQDNWMRLYMVPGMTHCQGGPGPDQFNKMAVIERWRESNTAPERDLGVPRYRQQRGYVASAVPLSAGRDL